MSYYENFNGCGCGFSRNRFTGKVKPIIMKRPMLQHNIKINSSVLKYQQTQAKTINNQTIPSLNLQSFTKEIIEKKYVVYNAEGLYGLHVSNQAKSGIYQTIQLLMRYALQASNIDEVKKYSDDIIYSIKKNIKREYNILHKNRGVYVFFDLDIFHKYFILPMMKFIFKNSNDIFTGRTGIFCNSLEAFCRHIYSNKYYAGDTPSLIFDKDDFAIIGFGTDSTKIFPSIKNVINNTMKDYSCFTILKEGLARLLVETDIDNIVNKYKSIIKDEKSFVNFYKSDISLKELKNALKQNKIKTTEDKKEASVVIKQAISNLTQEKKEIEKQVEEKKRNIKIKTAKIKQKEEKIKKVKDEEVKQEIKEEIKEEKKEIEKENKEIQIVSQEIKKVETEIKEIQAESKKIESDIVKEEIKEEKKEEIQEQKAQIAESESEEDLDKLFKQSFSQIKELFKSIKA